MDTSTTPESLIPLLRKAGLTEAQARIYFALVKHGASTPAELVKITGETRTNTYMVCDKLVQLGLATKNDEQKTRYAPENPTRLRQLLVNQQRQLKQANQSLVAILPALSSIYQLSSDKPGVTYLEGVSSLEQLYDDIIATKDTLRIFPSAHDDDDPNVSRMINKQIARQREARIKTEVLLRDEVYTSSHNDDLYEARRSPLGALDAQICMYGPNVTLTTFRSGIVTTIITNEMVAQTFRQLFQSMWEPPR